MGNANTSWELMLFNGTSFADVLRYAAAHAVLQADAEEQAVESTETIAVPLSAREAA
jgi:hypothetical protein